MGSTPSNTATRVRRLGVLAAASATALVASPLVAHADTDVPSHWEGLLQPSQEVCLANSGIKAVANGTATNGGARFRVYFNDELKFDSGAGSLGISNKRFELGQGVYKLCGKDPNAATAPTYVTLDLLVTRRP